MYMGNGYNWSGVDEAKFKKENPEGYRLWRVEQIVNYGGERLSEREVREVWPKIKDRLDPDRRKAIEFLIWEKPWRLEPGLLPDRSNFWQWYFKQRKSSNNSI